MAIPGTERLKHKTSKASRCNAIWTRRAFAAVTAGLLCAAFGTKSRAAADDEAFNVCQKIFSHYDVVLPGAAWRNTPLDANVEDFIKPDLYGDVVVRWMSYKNNNGTRTFILLTRGSDPQPEDDPDGFSVLIESGKSISLNAEIAANDIVVSKHQILGVFGLLTCGDGDIGAELTWNGHTWD